MSNQPSGEMPHGEIVTHYLELLAIQADPIKQLGSDSVTSMLAESDELMSKAQATTNVLERLDLLVRARQLRDRAEGRVSALELLEAEGAFINVAGEVSEWLGIEPDVWRAMGVPAPVLREAGLTKGQRGKARGSSTKPVKKSPTHGTLAPGDPSRVWLSAQVSNQLKAAIYANPETQNRGLKRERTAWLFEKGKAGKWTALRGKSLDDLRPIPRGEASVASFTLPVEMWNELEAKFPQLSAGTMLRLLADAYLLGWSES